MNEKYRNNINTIMNLVREHGIPLQYFEVASTEKCAE